ncbi:MAG: DUF4258 domain-containing protein [Tunicatimonas sp.]
MREFVLSKHAKEQLAIRRIDQELVWKTVEKPQQEIEEGSGKKIYQSVVDDEGDVNYLIRVFVNVVKHPKMIITVYRTSKIQKYWKDESEIR